MDYGMPCYRSGETVLVAFANQKQYIALYGCGGLLLKNHAEAAAAHGHWARAASVLREKPAPRT